MKLLFDLHTHTSASGHAYSSLKENIEEAYAKGLAAYGFSDHAPALPGAPTRLYFENLKIVPRNYREMKVYAGAEANIVDYDGNIDLYEKELKSVDYVIASMHSLCISKADTDRIMSGFIGAMQNSYVKIIGHPDDSRFPADYEELAKAAVKYKVALEVNNSSLLPTSARVGGRENILRLLDSCKRHGAYIICGTDAHIQYQVGDFENVLSILREADFPEELVLNTDMSGLDMILNKNAYIA